MLTVTRTELLQLLEDPDTARYAIKLAEIDPAYYTNPELGWRIAGDNAAHRKAVYRLIAVLEASGDLFGFNAYHNGVTIHIVKIEENYLRDLFAGIQ